MDGEPFRNEYLTSSQWSGTAPGSINYTGGNVGIGSASPAYTLDVTGDINFTGTFRQNGSPYIGSQWTTSGTAIYYTTGNVGIGTASPGSPLTVVGTSGTFVFTIGSTNTTLDFQPGTRFGTASPGFTTIDPNGSSPQGVGVWDLFVVNGGCAIGSTNAQTTPPGNGLIVAGNVGIGTTSPPGKLTVGTNGDAESMAVGAWSDRYFCVGQAPTPNSSCVSIGFNNTTAIGWIYSLAPSVAWRTLNFGAANYNFLCASTTPSMTISSTGINVPGVITNQGRPMSMVGKNSGGITTGVMIFNAVAYNIGSMYNSSNGRWTASVAGYYQFTFTGISNFLTNGPNMRWYKNGGEFAYGAAHVNSTNVTPANHMALACSVIIFLAVNDFVYFQSITNGFYGDSTLHSTACCIFLG